MDWFDKAWDSVVGGLDWLKQVVIGEFADHRDTSAVVADMLLSFVPAVVIVTSARDLTAIIMRLVKYPEKREHAEEWMLVVACAIPLVLPVLAAAVGAAAAGVGAVVGGIAGSEAGAALRAVCLLLIGKAMPLVEVVGFLRRFIKGNIMAVLRDIRFAQYGAALAKYISDFITALAQVCARVHAKLALLPGLDAVSTAMARLAELERSFYAVQASALTAVPRALAELDSRLQKVLADTLPHEPRPATTGQLAPLAVPQRAEPTRVASMQANPLGRPAATRPPPEAPHTPPEPNLHPETPREPKLQAMAEAKVPCFNAPSLPPAKYSEMDRQLAAQQAGLNNMTVQEYLDNRAACQEAGRGSGTVAAEARTQHQAQLMKSLRDRNLQQGMSPLAAEQLAIKDAAAQMLTMDALHSPDLIAGGYNVIDQLGDKNVNRAIGGGWPNKVTALDAAANNVPAAQRATTRMNAKLERCK